MRGILTKFNMGKKRDSRDKQCPAGSTRGVQGITSLRVESDPTFLFLCRTHTVLEQTSDTMSYLPN